MGLYIVAAPFVLGRDGGVVHYTEREVGKSVELSDDEAAALVAAGTVSLVDTPMAPFQLDPTVILNTASGTEPIRKAAAAARRRPKANPE